MIFENKSECLGIKSSVLREHLAIQRSSENIDPEEIVVYYLTKEPFGL